MHKVFLQQAVDLAAENARSGQGGPYGAIIVKDNQLVAASGNKVTSTIDPTAHAEVMAIRLACKKLNDFQLQGCILYSSCEPCPMCLGAIYWARLAKVYFACSRHDAAAANFDDSFIYDEISVLPHERRIAMLHLNLPSAMEPFNIWAEKSDKVLY
ncbi:MULTISPECIES: nucleoside deaminase [Methylobacter]|jgi:Cytidine and deoxycytidylate deaminase zinc-binding region.|uniref:Guanine deaminase n=1 Tax=Methylobacter tundripaludum (strain ATCC BAA-1195 / DSM 17260 / SV96) TaxID=697282 RepID=G3ISL6_METTV|nr:MULTISPECIES: nucleoside deaminase [Methylobacter]EGW22386.1 Guanine deaminase [Methylobacter tundripaludum SV96]MDD4906530.1 nucleoside deaminase [Methylobacter tundripaludum]MDI1279162.1 nucleoside deaminase [Methylobacter sp.]MDI1359964.1 nucleoside deaminase [Methylobacter sp.]